MFARFVEHGCQHVFKALRLLDVREGSAHLVVLHVGVDGFLAELVVLHGEGAVHDVLEEGLELQDGDGFVGAHVVRGVPCAWALYAGGDDVGHVGHGGRRRGSGGRLRRWGGVCLR